MSDIPPEPPDPPQSNANHPAEALNSSHTSRGNQPSRRGRKGNNPHGHLQHPPNLPREGISSNPTAKEHKARWSRVSQAREHTSGRGGGPSSLSREPASQDDGVVSRHSHSSHNSDRSRKTPLMDAERHGRTGEAEQQTSKGTKAAFRGHSRRGKFGSQLSGVNNRPAYMPKRAKTPPLDSDLATRLIYALRTPPYPDCPICFNPLHPAQPTWSCSLNEEVTSCCWASFHLKCVREWARKSTKEVKDAFVARGEFNEEGYWRCPGCQAKRTQVPRSYQCFCGAISDPKPGIATPHSCGMSCSRKRKTCEHSCPLNCHPGPCPTCVLTVHPPCYCGKTEITMRCANARAIPSPSLSCNQPCNRPLACSNHFCADVCHPGDCRPCTETEVITCFCGKHTKPVPCGEGVENLQEAFVITANGDEKKWIGRYACEDKCNKYFACGKHICSKDCHTPSPTPDRCPSDPQLVTHCPCGKHPLSDLSSVSRTSCTDEIPTCDSTCGKTLEGCSHLCSAVCHHGPCPPCLIPITVWCRCKSTSRSISCREMQLSILNGEEIVLCDKICGVLRLCGRHQCTRICCPLATLSKSKGKNKKKPVVSRDIELEEQELLWHECDLVCGKLLACGNHRCSESDHKGACPPCLQSSFEELACNCGRTVLLPPISCGTNINCTYPCTRPPPPCGHGRTSHTCHEDVSCPPCPFLATKRCACGKSNINNVRCSQEKVLCGQPCGKLLDCGFHRCQKLCHGDDCGACPSICGKPRKLCLPAHHPCTLSCHAPSACSEDEPCDSTITVTCPCGRYQQPVKCGRSTTNSSKTASALLCRDECHIAKRNARLAEALGITDTKKKADAAYSEELISFGKSNSNFLSLVEKTLNDFVTLDKKTQVLPYMPESRRNFVRELCQIYRIDTQLVDQEPRRSVQLHHRIDNRIPNPILSSFIASQSATSTLGRLTDLRAMPLRPALPSTPPVRPAVVSASSRGWTNVVTSSPQASTSRAPPVPVVPKARTNHTAVRDSWESD